MPIMPGPDPAPEGPLGHCRLLSDCASFPSGLVVALPGSHTTSSNQGTVEGNGARAPASAPPGFVGELGPPSPDSGLRQHVCGRKLRTQDTFWLCTTPSSDDYTP